MANGRTIGLTFGGGQYANPVWTPDGQYVVFRSTNGSMYSARADGSGQPQLATERQGQFGSNLLFPPDGKRLAFMLPVSGSYQLWTTPVEEQGGKLQAGTPEQFLKSEAADAQPVFSPMCKWLAYGSNLSGIRQIYVRPASGQAGQWVVSTSGQARDPVWSRERA